MTIAHMGLKVKVMDQASAVGPTSIEGSFLSSCHCGCCVYSAGAYSSLLRELVAEFTLTDNPANTTTSLLRSLCHTDDSIILGTWLQETDHKTIEDQVIISN